jgi:uncharacterized protein YjbI with pentapeptide repeats
MTDSIAPIKTALTSLLDRILASHVRSACGLFHEVDLQIATEDKDFDLHLKWTQKMAVETIQSLQPGLTREEIDNVFHPFREEYPFIPEEVYQLYQWRNGVKGGNPWHPFVHHHSFTPLQNIINDFAIIHSYHSSSNLFNTDNKQRFLVVFKPILERGASFSLLLGSSPIAPIFRHDGEHQQIDLRSHSLTHFIIEEFRGGWKTLAYAYLAHMSVPGADLTKIDCCHANMRGANLIFTNLTKADLSYADLTGSNLSGANLSEANLTGANLTAAVLKDADLTDANLTDVIFGDTVMPDGRII